MNDTPSFDQHTQCLAYTKRNITGPRVRLLRRIHAVMGLVHILCSSEW